MAADFLLEPLTIFAQVCYNTCEAVAFVAQVKQGVYRSRGSFPVLRDGDCAKGAISVSSLSVLIELIGETVHMIMLNASHIGALLFQIHAWFRTKRR